MRPMSHSRRRRQTQNRTQLVGNVGQEDRPSGGLLLHGSQCQKRHYVGRGYAGSLLNQPKEIHSRNENGFRRFEEKEGTRRPHRLPGIINEGVMRRLIQTRSLSTSSYQLQPPNHFRRHFYLNPSSLVCVCLTLQETVLPLETEVEALLVKVVKCNVFMDLLVMNIQPNFISPNNCVESMYQDLSRSTAITACFKKMHNVWLESIEVISGIVLM